jgi:hypothetical protein
MGNNTCTGYPCGLILDGNSLQFDPAPRAGEPMVSRRVPDYFLVSFCFHLPGGCRRRTHGSRVVVNVFAAKSDKKTRWRNVLYVCAYVWVLIAIHNQEIGCILQRAMAGNLDTACFLVLSRPKRGWSPSLCSLLLARYSCLLFSFPCSLSLKLRIYDDGLKGRGGNTRDMSVCRF